MSAPHHAPDLTGHIIRRATHAGVVVDSALATRLAAYVAHLARWNRTMNLTALPVDPPTDEAIDRLIVEPVAATPFVRSSDRLAVDIGSGGGSPAIPLNLAAPHLHFVLVEAKTRKSSFLREAGRHLGLPHLRVETMRAEELGDRPELRAVVDIVTIRAVRVDRALLESMKLILAPGGRVLWFGGASDFERIPEGERLGFSARSGEGILSGTAVLSTQ